MQWARISELVLSRQGLVRLLNHSRLPASRRNLPLLCLLGLVQLPAALWTIKIVLGVARLHKETGGCLVTFTFQVKMKNISACECPQYRWAYIYTNNCFVDLKIKVEWALCPVGPGLG